jgi:membrane-associated phospholipid phosphatase
MKAPRTPARVGVLTRQPLAWASVITGIAAGGPRGRRAALRGTLCYLLGAIVGNGVKPLFQRPQPRHRWKRKPQVVRGAFPSGHGAAEVACTFGAAQELPSAFIPLAAMALTAHWSLVRAGKHYVSDLLVGGTIGLALSVLVARVWPTRSGLVVEPTDPRS